MKLSAVSLALLAALAVQRGAKPAPSADLVELDVVVLDRYEQPVAGLRQEDFQVKEDGHLVDVKTFSPVSVLGSMEADDARIVTLLMDDIGVPMAGTGAMQAIAQVVMSPASRGDELSVVRLSKAGDEAFGDFGTARDRIAGYRGGVVPFSRRDTPEAVLKAVARIATQLEPIEHRRKAIICLGLTAVCNVEDPQQGAYSVLWPSWVAALTAAARANVSVYSVDPTGLNQRTSAPGAGLVTMTGGERFANSNDFVRAADTIWRQASRYYLLGYWPSTDRRALHSIDVKVARKDVHLRFHHTR
jgi:VWFA-related protein